MRRRESGVTLVEVAAAVTLVGILLALLIPAWMRGRRFEKVLACEGHFHALYTAQAKAPAAGPTELGSQYWVRLTKSAPPLVESDSLRCPLADPLESPACQYLGPAINPAQASPKEPIGCDLEHNHSEDGKEGGNVLMKSGEVVTDHTGVWINALRGGKCRP